MDSTKKLGEEKIFKLLLMYSIPAIVGMLINSVYNIIDRMFIGNSSDLSTFGLAGITISFPIVIILMAVALLFGMGGSILFSIRLGQGKNEEAEKILGLSVFLLIISGIVLMILGLLLIDPLLMLFGSDEEVLPYAREYMRFILFGAVFQNISMGMNNFVRADGHPKMAMITMFIGAIVNIILDPIFIYVFRWGMMGAALATIIGQACSAIWIMLHFTGKKCSIKFNPKHMKPDLHYTFQIIAYGTSSFLLQIASCILTIILNKSLKKYGDLSIYGSTVAISGLGIINSLVTLFVLPVIGINQGAQPIISYNYGANNHKRVKQTLLLAILSATIMVNIGYLITRLFPNQLISIFNEDPKLIEFSVKALKVWFLCMPIVGFQIVGANYFQAVGKVYKAIFLSMSRQILFLIPAILILSSIYGLTGILYATPFADICSVIITAIFLFIELRKYDKLDEPSPVTEN